MQVESRSYVAICDRHSINDDDDVYSHIVLQVVVAAWVLPEAKESLTMSVVGGTLLSQKEGGVPQLIWDFSNKNQSSRIYI